MKQILKFVQFLVITSIIATQDNISIEQIKKLKENMEEALKYVNETGRNENIIMCFGLTKSGKSTFVNYYLGNELIAEDVIDGIILRKKDKNSSGPEIESGIVSETKIPQKWISDHSKLSIWDAPGVEDNRGPIQDITNAFYIYQLFKTANSLKVVLIVDFSDILNHNIRQFTTLLSAMETLLGDGMGIFFNSISVIFTKVPTHLNEKKIDVAYVTKILEKKFLPTSDDNSDFSQISKDFVRHLIKNKENIGLFRTAEVGLVKSKNIDVNIFQAINNIKAASKYSLSQVLPSISDKSLLFLGEARDKMFPPETFEELIKAIEKYSSCQKELVLGIVHQNIKSIGKLNQMKLSLDLSLKRITEALSDTTYDKVIEALQQIDPELDAIIRNENLLEKYRLMEFVNKILKREKQQIDTRLKEVLSIAKTTIEYLTDSLKREIKMKEEAERIEYERQKMELRRREERRRGPVSKILGTVGTVVDNIAGGIFSLLIP